MHNRGAIIAYITATNSQNQFPINPLRSGVVSVWITRCHRRSLSYLLFDCMVPPWGANERLLFQLSGIKQSILVIPWGSSIKNGAFNTGD